ncbi:MAG: RluA family pseudouridine synthase [Rikenellaceae bacterium]
MKNLEYTVSEPTQLLESLFANLGDKSKTTVKSYLSNRQVSINGCATTQFNAPLAQGDRGGVSFTRQKESFRHPLIKVVYEDDSMLVVSKREGLLSIATDKEPIKNAYAIMSHYIKRDNPSARLFVVHRLDRETSGLMLFAKNREIQQTLQFNWNENILERKYYAVVEGVIEQDEGVIESYLTESKALKVYATDHEHGKLAITAFKVLRRAKENSLLELQLETGRKNQIRAHLEYVGHSIVGDKKYGAKSNPLSRVALHAGSISFVHPVSGERMDFRTSIPELFEAIFGGSRNYKKNRDGQYKKKLSRR